MILRTSNSKRLAFFGLLFGVTLVCPGAKREGYLLVWAGKVLLLPHPSGAQMLTIPGEPKEFEATPSGNFLYCTELSTQGGRWFAGNVDDPNRLKEVHPPLLPDELLLSATLSHDGGRVAWSTHHKGQNGRVVVTDVATGRDTVVLERPAVGIYVTFAPVTWSHDDTKIACFYLLSSGIEEDLVRKVRLLGVDLAGDKPKGTDVLGKPVVCNAPLKESISWSPDDTRLQFDLAKDPLTPGGDSESYVVGYDGNGFGPAAGTIFLKGNQYAVEGMKFEKDERAGVFHATGSRKDLRTGHTEPLKFEFPTEPIFFSWSPDGDRLAGGVIVRDEAYKNLPSSVTRIFVVDTRTGVKTALGEVDTLVDGDEVFWLQP